MKSSIKIDKIQKAVNGCTYSAILGTETNWDSSIQSEEVFGSRFTVFRDDRDLELTNKKSGGGVLIAINANFEAEQIPSKKYKEFEHVWVKTRICNEIHIFVSVYFPPQHSNKSSFEIFFNEMISIASNFKLEYKIHLYGDFNQRSVDFIQDEENNSVLLPVVGENETLILLFDKIASLGLYQINHVKNMQNRYLDLLFTNILEDFCVTEASLPLWRNESFHTAIEFSLFIHKSCRRPLDCDYEEILDYNKANYSLIENKLNHTDWQNLLHRETNIDEAVNKFYTVLYAIINDGVPKKRKRRTHNESNPPWFSRELKNLRNRKQKAHKKYKQNRNSENFQTYYSIHNQLETAIERASEEYHRKIEYNIKSDPKVFFSYVKTKLKSTNFPSRMDLDGKDGTNDGEICNLFANFFQSVYTTYSDSDRDHDYFRHLPEIDNDISVQQITENEINTALKNLKISKGPGPDGLPPIFLKSLASSMSKPLFWLFNLSLKTEMFPATWKKSFLVPIYKSGKKSDIKNYRGIAILSCIPKLFESIVNEKIYCQMKHYITEHQHGFYKGRSTTTNLVQFISFTLNAMDNGNFVQTIYTDFSKAFDRIDIPMLLFKLHKMGISKKLLEWLKSYLTGRQQSVKFNGKISLPIVVSSGVPQGSHLGPLLFILYVNDVSLILSHIKVLIYADDMKLYAEIRDPSDVITLQNEINIFSEWCKKSLLDLNVKKCNSISFSRKRETPEITINLNNQPVPVSDKVRDLGVLLDSKLTFTDHYNGIIHKASNMLNFIKRFSYSFCDPYTIKTLYISYVRSILEYCNIVWSPYQAAHVERIESVQKQFLLFALRKLGWTVFPLPSYESRCKLIRLETLKKRREFTALSFVNDLISQRVQSPEILHNLNFYAPSRQLRTRQLFFIKPYRTNYAKHGPLNRIMKIYNSNCEIVDVTMNRSMLRKNVFYNG